MLTELRTVKMTNPAGAHARLTTPALGSAAERATTLTPGRTLLDFFEQYAALDAEFLVYDDGYRSWSYRYDEIANAARAFAYRLRRESVGSGDKVLIWSENRPEWVAAFWGCVLNGTVVVPVDYRASSEVLRNTNQAVGARVVLVGDDVRPSSLEVPIWRLSEIDLRVGPSPLASPKLCSDDIAELVFTSGSTAAPKGVVITHRNIVADLEPIQREVIKYRFWLRPLFPLRFLSLLPLSHMFGQALAMFFPPMLPGVVVFMRGYSPHEVIRQLRRRRISFLVCVPKMLEMLRQYVVRRFPESAEPANGDSHWIARWWRNRRIHRMFGLKFLSFVVGGAPLEPGLEEFWSRLGFLVVQGYGLTETAPIVTFSHPFHGHPIGSAGKPLPGVDVRLESDGEILVRGEIVTPGYFNAPTESMKAFEHGWFHTGDIGKFDENGYLFVRGRKKEMIVTPEGLKVFPEDVELVINAIPGVVDSAVVGKDRVHAVLVLEPGADSEEVIRAANSRLEAHQKIRTASIWTAGKLPRTEGTGKLKRSAIQKWVDAGAPAAPPAARDDVSELIAKYAPGRAITPDTTLDQLGLSSLERVELLVEIEQEFNTSIDEAAFTGVHTVADLARILREPTSAAEPTEDVVTWNRGIVARTIRRAALATIVIPLTPLLAHLKVTGREHLAAIRGPVIFAANHQSHLDTPAILTALPARLRSRIAPAMLKEFFDGYFRPERHTIGKRIADTMMYFAASLFFNGFPLPQEGTATRQAMRQIGELVSDDWSILIFPEGERTQVGEIKSFFPGAAMAAARFRIPVIPIRLRGLEQILHTGRAIPKPGAASVSFGPALMLWGEDYRVLAKQIEDAVRAL